MDDKNPNAYQPSGCGWLSLVFCASLALFLAWFFLNLAFVQNVREWRKLWHTRFPTWQDWHNASEPVRLAGWKLGSVMCLLDSIAGLLVFGGILLIFCWKQAAWMTTTRSIGTWLLATSPSILMVVGAVVGALDHWSNIHERTDGTNAEMALFRDLGMHSLAWSMALFLAAPFAWVRWEWKQALFVSVFCVSIAIILGIWGITTLLTLFYLIGT